jgi:hypothetical protein
MACSSFACTLRKCAVLDEKGIAGLVPVDHASACDRFDVHVIEIQMETELASD